MNSKKSRFSGNLSRFSRRPSQKKGLIGGILSTFVATVVILIIILVFILGSGIIKTVTGAGEGVIVVSESQIGLSNIFGYLQNYIHSVDNKILFRQGKLFEIRGVEGNGNYETSFEEVELFLWEKKDFIIGTEEHSIKILELSEGKVSFGLSSELQAIELRGGEVGRVDLNRDGFEDIELKLLGVDTGKGIVRFSKRILTQHISSQEPGLEIKVGGFPNKLPKTLEELPTCEYVAMGYWKKVSYPDKICTSGVDGCLTVVIPSEDEAVMAHLPWQEDILVEKLLNESLMSLTSPPAKAYVLGGYRNLSEENYGRIKNFLNERGIEISEEVKDYLYSNLIMSVYYDVGNRSLYLFREEAITTSSLDKKLYPFSFFNNVLLQDRISMVDFRALVSNKVSNGYSAVVIGEYHYQKDQKDAAIEIMESILASGKKIIFLEEGYGNTDSLGGEIFQEIGVETSEGSIIFPTDYRDFLKENDNIRVIKLFNQFDPCNDVKKLMKNLIADEVLVVYVGATHSSEDYYDFFGDSRSALVKEIPVKTCIDELNKKSLIIMMADLDTIISYSPGDIISNLDGENYFAKYREDIYIGKF